jgi:hypothetical protein
MDRGLEYYPQELVPQNGGGAVDEFLAGWQRF